MTTTMRFLGNAGYEIVGPAWRVLIDPYLRGCPGAPCTPEELDPPDVILVTHAAYNHMGDAAEIAIATGAPVVCAVDVAKILASRGVPDDQLLVTIWGVRVRVRGVEVLPVMSAHWSFGISADGTAYSGPPLGYLVEPEPGLRILHTADSALFDMGWMATAYRPTVGIYCCSMPWEMDKPPVGEYLSGEMTPQEAATAAEMMKVQIAVASHYLDRDAMTDAFLAAVPAVDAKRQALAPAPGETIVFDHDARGNRWTGSVMAGPQA